MEKGGGGLREAVEHQRAGRFDEAAAIYRRMLEGDPDNPLVLFNLGLVHHFAGRSDAAVPLIARAAELAPGEAQVQIRLAEIFMAAGRGDEAVEHLQGVIARMPGAAGAHVALGQIHAAAGRFDDALASCREGCRLDPANADYHLRLGGVFKSLERPAEAEAALRRALALQPDAVSLRPVLAQLLLVQGRLAEGWREFESRLQADVREWAGFLERIAPRWDGSPLAGKSILVVWEQGLGDTIQFIRYVPLLAAEGARVLVHVQPAVEPLVARIPGIERIVTQGEPIPAADWQVTLPSLPHLLASRIGAAIPDGNPYLGVGDAVVAAWRRRLAPVDGVKVGIAWQGNPGNPADLRRSVPLSQFLPLARVPGVRLVSIQAVHGLEQMKALPPDVEVLDFGDDLTRGGDLTEAAGLISALDLVVSIDSAMVHLAGALGRPVWAPIMFNPCWRWQLHREDSPWYPSVRLFRERHAGDWQDVFRRIAVALGERM